MAKSILAASNLTDKEVQLLLDRYPNERTELLAAELGWSQKKVTRLANKFGIHKTKQFISLIRTSDGKKYAQKTHGLSHSKTYQIWKNMMSRCYSSGSKRFVDYGGRGIVVCDRWKTFANFISDMGECPSGYSIERINNNACYSPENCKWIPFSRQGRNKRNTVYIEHGGLRLPMIEWSERTGIPYSTLAERIYSGWDFERALTAPVNGRLRRKRKVSGSNMNDVNRESQCLFSEAA